MKISKSQQQNGFTLIEILLLISIILIILISAYSYYGHRQLNENVNLQITYLERIQTSLDSAYITSNNFSNLSTANAIAWGIIPAKLKVDAGNANHVFGGAMTFAASPTPILGRNGYSISLAQLSPETCTKLVLSEYGSKMPQVLVNGVDVKTPGAVFDETNLANVSGACASSAVNTVEFRGYPIQPFTAVGGTLTPAIPKANPYSIPTVGNIVTSGAVVCSGGSSWNGSFCGCPSGAMWNGSACVGIDTTAQTCQYGKGWNGSSCVTLPRAIPAIPVAPVPAPSVAGPTPAPVPVYLGSRQLPFTPSAPIQEVNAQASCTGAGGNWDGRVCNYCPVAASAVIRDSSGNVVSLARPAHPAASSWNGFRCVTPAVGW